MHKNLLSRFMITALFLTACASPPPHGNIPSTANPREEISKLNISLDRAHDENIDVLARKEY